MTAPRVDLMITRGEFATREPFFVSGQGVVVEDSATRAVVAQRAAYERADRYVLCELKLTEVRCNGYGDTPLPARQRWSASG